MPVTVYSVPFKKHFVTHTRCSQAYCLFLAYWVSLVAVPIIVVSSLPIRYSVAIENPAIEYTGNYFISADGRESSILNPLTGVSVAVEQQDQDNDKLVDNLIVTVNSFAFKSVKSLFIALEIRDEYGDTNVVHIPIIDPDAGNRLVGWFKLTMPKTTSTGIPQTTFLEALMKPGTKGLTKLASVETQYLATPVKFGVVSDTVANSSTFNAVINIDCPLQTNVRATTTSETFFTNLAVFVTTAVANYVILDTLMKIIIKLRLVRLQVVRSQEFHQKVY